jgi:hypothetical protein
MLYICKLNVGVGHLGFDRTVLISAAVPTSYQGPGTSKLINNDNMMAKIVHNLIIRVKLKAVIFTILAQHINDSNFWPY